MEGGGLKLMVSRRGREPWKAFLRVTNIFQDQLFPFKLKVLHKTK